MGLSGGGQMALLCAAKSPSFFKANGAFVPVCDLKRWAKENVGYAKDVYACCGEDEEEIKKRSPINYVRALAKSNLKIFHGKFDEVVSYGQSYDLYKAIMESDSNARVFLDIFDGGHEINMDVAFEWILSQHKKKALTLITG